MPAPGKGHGDTVLVTGINHFRVAYAATGLYDVFHTVLIGGFNAIAEREKASEISTEFSMLRPSFN